VFQNLLHIPCSSQQRARNTVKNSEV